MANSKTTKYRTLLKAHAEKPRHGPSYMAKICDCKEPCDCKRVPTRPMFMRGGTPFPRCQCLRCRIGDAYNIGGTGGRKDPSQSKLKRTRDKVKTAKMVKEQIAHAEGTDQ